MQAEFNLIKITVRVLINSTKEEIPPRERSWIMNSYWNLKVCMMYTVRESGGGGGSWELKSHRRCLHYMYKIRIELLDIYIHTHTQSNSIISLKNKVCLYTPFSRIRDFTNWQAQASNLIGLKLKRGLNYNLIFSPAGVE